MSRLAPIFAPWDGNAEAMAADINEPSVNVRAWRNRGNIPTRAWKRIIAAAAAKGHELTWEMFVPESEVA